MSTLHGIDVSHWQAGLDLAKTDAQFVIIKATEGTATVDSECDRFYQRAKSLGLLRGVYHFYRGGGAREADHFTDSTRAYHGDALLVLDFETNTADTAGALAFLDRVKARTGVTPGIYTNPNVINTQRSGITRIAQAGYWLWLARWGSTPGDISPWTTLTLWQYTDAHKTGGTAVDGDRFYGTAGTWHALAAGPGADTTDTGDDDMAWEHVVRARTTDQNLNDADDWQTIKVREDDESNTKQIVAGPAKITGAVFISAGGLGADGYVEARCYAVDDPDGSAETRTHSGPIVTLHAKPGGSTHGALPIPWDLGASGKKGVPRRLRLEVRSPAKGAVITGVRVDAWAQDK